MIEVVDGEGKVWLNPGFIQSMRDYGGVVEVVMKGGAIHYVKDTTAAKLARRIAGSDI